MKHFKVTLHMLDGSEIIGTLKARSQNGAEKQADIILSQLIHAVSYNLERVK